MLHSDKKSVSDELLLMLKENENLLEDIDSLIEKEVPKAREQAQASSVDFEIQSEEHIENSQHFSAIPIIDFNRLERLHITLEMTEENDNTPNEMLSEQLSHQDSDHDDNIQHDLLTDNHKPSENQENIVNDTTIASQTYHKEYITDNSEQLQPLENTFIENEVYSEQVVFNDNWLTVFAILVLMWLFFWFNQNPINIYFQQKYHQSSPLEQLDHFNLWQIGKHSNESFYDGLVALVSISENHEVAQILDDILTPDVTFSQIDNSTLPLSLASTSEIKVVVKPKKQSSPPLIKAEQNIPDTKDSSSPNVSTTSTVQLKEKTEEVIVKAEPKIQNTNVNYGVLRGVNVLDENINTNQRQFGYLLQEGEKVFFAGDSLMQGVAPHVANKLKKQFNVSSIDLSKQSTGLTYMKSFNWLETIEKTLEKNNDIGLLVVMLGANDPWDMQVRKNEPYMRFGSEAWNAEYLSRIDYIYQLAAQRGIGVIWISAPAMRKSDLNKGVLHLDTLYKQMSDKYGGIYLESNIMFGYENYKYDSHAQWEGKKVKIRADDGVHFTPTGQRIIAQYILSVIGINETR